MESTLVLNPSPKHEGLDEAAALAVRLWRFEPTKQNGHPINAASVQKIAFKL